MDGFLDYDDVVYNLSLTMKNPWLSNMPIFERGFFSLLTMIYVRILYEELHSDIGMNMLMERGQIYLGMGTMKDDFVSPPILYFHLLQFSIL